MASSDNNTIRLYTVGAAKVEAEAAATITPGMLIEFDGTGKLQPHSNDYGTAAKIFAIENDDIGDTITDDYVATESVKALNCVPGNEVLAWANTGQSIAKDAYVTSAGNGYLTVLGVQEADSVVGQAVEAVVGGASPMQFAMRVM